MFHTLSLKQKGRPPLNRKILRTISCRPFNQTTVFSRPLVLFHRVSWGIQCREVYFK